MRLCAACVAKRGDRKSAIGHGFFFQAKTQETYSRILQPRRDSESTTSFPFSSFSSPIEVGVPFGIVQTFGRRRFCLLHWGKKKKPTLAHPAALVHQTALFSFFLVVVVAWLAEDRHAKQVGRGGTAVLLLLKKNGGGREKVLDGAIRTQI